MASLSSSLENVEVYRKSFQIIRFHTYHWAIAQYSEPVAIAIINSINLAVLSHNRPQNKMTIYRFN